MTKNLSIKWNGGKEDPDSINQYGIDFPSGEFVSVPADHPKIDKFIGNKYFEVKGRETPTTELSNDGLPKPPGAPSIASVVTYSVQRQGNGKGRPSTFIVVGRDTVTQANIDGPKDEYVDEESAQVVADALNQTPTVDHH